MKFFSIHHCVLIFLTLIFTTAPASADVTIWGRLHQPVTLTCKHDCAPRVAKWNDLKTRSVFAQCDETSCSSYKEGYKMSHDQYVKGDLSLTITAADYSKRNRYACECGAIDYSIQRLRIATVFSAVQMSPAEDLLLDLSVPEPVKVFYRSSDSADDELICNVTQSSAQCSSKYTSRTSLHHLQLTLRGVTSSDSGTYTIQNTEYNEDIIVYNVSVRGLSKGMITLIVLLLLLLLLVISGIIIYGCIIYMKLKRRMEEVKRIIKQIESVNKHTAEGQRNSKVLIVRAEEKINDLENDYRQNRILSARVKLYCSVCRSDLEIYKTIYVIDHKYPALSTEEQEKQMEVIKQIEKMKQEDKQQLKRRMKEVKRIINQIESVNKYTAEGQREIKKLIESRGED
ncbi:uncharacterized protein LOC124380485 isoform X2 [Silurus meridionalis]|uniref:uncharacterized protein LOC124380485 isoform X2 n=1 Tax=Silurus meridionalis TaxID=175797 RepID=UPI001EEC4AC7|nr:uncharacterized protein LOC124380485 isoform X2 [Silurus meridionalis]